MVLVRLNMHQILRVFEVCGTYTATWPMSAEVKGFQRLMHDFYWSLMIANLFLTALSIGAFAYQVREDTIPMIKAICQMTAFIDAALSVFLTRVQNDEMQVLLAKTKSFVKNANSSEMAILQKRINHYITFYTCVTILYLTCTTTFVVAPIFVPHEYLLDSWYPFKTDYFLMKMIIFLSQFIALYEVSFLIFFEFTITMFMWYPSARLEMIMDHLKNTTEVEDFNWCIKEHQEIIQYLHNVNNVIHPMVFKTNATMGTISICAVFPLLRPQLFDVIIQLATMLGSALQRLFIYTWPADDLKEISQRVSFSVYDWSWIGQSKGTGRSAEMMLQRSQKPLTINMIFLPPLSLEYFSAFLKTLMSYFMALRSAIGID